MQVDLSRCVMNLGVSFYKGPFGGVFYCDYAGIIESGDTLQEAFDAAYSEHARLCMEEDLAKRVCE